MSNIKIEKCSITPTRIVPMDGLPDDVFEQHGQLDIWYIKKDGSSVYLEDCKLTGCKLEVD